ncbi:hypothetical protein J5N97_020469 [Dioscorea zingiberensis]|uniref:OTU domain-containing protein n=1 Tax=Dioscorea zingiberensis TaxID=325984 RepID=A0A9D5HDP4_9LILI|nr:hypothetical protein J5N97_020469 [Dioscorea zingiberensis]
MGGAPAPVEWCAHVEEAEGARRWPVEALLTGEELRSGSRMRGEEIERERAGNIYILRGDIDTDHTNVENNEILAHALQEELSQVAAEEASQSTHIGDEHVPASVLAQDWLGPSARYTNLGTESVLVEMDDMEHSSLCSFPGEFSYEGEVRTIEITDDFYALDGEVEKRLNQKVPIPNVPRINGEIPSVDEATSDHQRLLDMLQLYELVELKVQGDGNCQFQALSNQFYRTPEHHKSVRQQGVDQLKSYPEIYEGYVPMAYDEYLKKLSKCGEWGDWMDNWRYESHDYLLNLILARVLALTDTCYIEILPVSQKSNRVIFLSFWAEVHYNSIYPEGEQPTKEGRKKRKWWNFVVLHVAEETLKILKASPRFAVHILSALRNRPHLALSFFHFSRCHDLLFFCATAHVVVRSGLRPAALSLFCSIVWLHDSSNLSPILHETNTMFDPMPELTASTKNFSTGATIRELRVSLQGPALLWCHRHREAPLRRCPREFYSKMETPTRSTIRREDEGRRLWWQR